MDIYDEFLEHMSQTKKILTILTQNLEKLKALEKEIKSTVTSKKDQGIFLEIFSEIHWNILRNQGDHEGHK